MPFIASARSVLFALGAGDRLLDPAQGAASSSSAIGGDEPRHGLLAEQVPAADRLHDAGVRHRLRVPDPARRPPAGRRGDARSSSPSVRRYAIVGIAVLVAVVTPVGRPDQHARPDHPDVPLLRGVDPHRPARRRRRGSGRRPTRATRRPRSGRRSSIGCRSRSTPSRSRRSTPSTPAARCSWPRRPARARRSSPSTPSPSRSAAGRQGLLHDADQGAVEPEVRRPRRRLGADRVGLLTGDNAINGDAPVVVMTTEVLRNMIYARSPALAACATWCSTRSTTSRTPTAARCGRR